MNDPVIRPIPLDRLERSPANVRRTEAGKSAFAELKAVDRRADSTPIGALMS